MFEIGDIVFAASDIHNDGGVPDADEGAVLAHVGARGVVVRVGPLRRRDRAPIYLVRFEGIDQLLGPAIACLHDELAKAP
jgi:nitrogen fixation protein NifZ